MTVAGPGAARPGFLANKLNMTIVVFVGALLLLGIAVIAVAWPLLQERRGQFQTDASAETLLEADPLVALYAQRDALYRETADHVVESERGEVMRLAHLFEAVENDDDDR